MNILAIGGGDKRLAMEAALEGLSSEQNLVTIIPTACSTIGSYNTNIPKVTQFFTELGLKTEVLHDFREVPSEDKIADLLGRSSMLYTIGGNTPYALEQFAKTNIREVLKKALLTTDVIHAGAGTGALLPFELMHSNPEKTPKSKLWTFAMLEGLGLLPGVATVHAELHDPIPGDTVLPYSRLQHLASHFPDSQEFGIGIDSGAAVILGNNAQIVRTKPEARVHFLQRSNDGFVSAEHVDDISQLRQFAV